MRMQSETSLRHIDGSLLTHGWHDIVMFQFNIFGNKRINIDQATVLEYFGYTSRALVIST